MLTILTRVFALFAAAQFSQGAAVPGPSDALCVRDDGFSALASRNNHHDSSVVKVIQSTDGTPIYARATGDSSKPSMVFVHGLALSGAVFDELFVDPSLLSKFYLVSYDMRGHGRSGMPNTAAGHSSALYAADFAKVVKAFNLKTPLFVGWSLGATVAADICQQLGPSAISGIVYVNALPFIGPIMNLVGTPLILGMLPGFFSTDDVVLGLSTKIAFANSVFNDPTNVPVAVKWTWLGSTFLQFPAITELVLTRSQDPTALFKAGANGLPLLIINGSADKQVQGTVVVQQIAPQFKNVKVATIAGGSHAVFFDNQTSFINALVPFATQVTKTH